MMVTQRMPPAAGTARRVLDRLEHFAPMQESRRGVRAHRIVQMLGHLAVVFLGRRQHQPHTGLAIVLPESEHQLDRQRRAVRENRVYLQSVIVPAPLQAGGEGAAQRGVRGFVEQIHDRLTDERFIGAEQLEPRRIGIHDDAFLNLDDGIVRALQDYFQLAPRVVGGLERAVQRALESESAQLAQNHRLQTRGIAQRNKVARAELHGIRNASLVGGIRQCR